MHLVRVAGPEVSSTGAQNETVQGVGHAGGSGGETVQEGCRAEGSDGDRSLEADRADGNGVETVLGADHADGNGVETVLGDDRAHGSGGGNASLEAGHAEGRLQLARTKPRRLQLATAWKPETEALQLTAAWKPEMAAAACMRLLLQAWMRLLVEQLVAGRAPRAPQRKQSQNQWAPGLLAHTGQNQQVQGPLAKTE